MRLSVRWQTVLSRASEDTCCPVRCHVRTQCRCCRCFKQLANLGGKNIVAAMFVMKKVAVAALRQAQSVPRGHIVITNAGIPCGLDGAVCFIVCNELEFISERNAPHSEPEGRLVVAVVCTVCFLSHVAPRVAPLDHRVSHLSSRSRPG